MGQIIRVEIIPWENKYKLPDATHYSFYSNLNELKVRLIEKHNRRIIGYLNEPSLSNEMTEARKKYWDKNNWEDIEFYINDNL